MGQKDNADVSSSLQGGATRGKGAVYDCRLAWRHAITWHLVTEHVRSKISDVYKTTCKYMDK